MPPKGANLIVNPDGTLAIAPMAVGTPGAALMSGPAFRATGTPGGTSPMYGLGGLFGISDAHPTVINAMVGPIGVERILRWRGSIVQSPRYESLVHIGSTGFDQTGLCADCGKPSFKECTQSACFGRVCQMTNEHAVDMIGLHGTFNVPRVALFGSITDPAGNVLLAQGQEITDMFTLELAGASYNLRGQVARDIWTGNPAGNVGGRWQFPGLQLLVNTGKFDVRTGLDCDALDSVMIPFGGAVVGAAGSPSIVASVGGLIRSIRYRVFAMGKNPDDMVTWLVMHPRHWDCLTRAWACEYGLTCEIGAPTRNDAMAIAKLRDQWMAAMHLPIDGKFYPVALDNQLPSTPTYYGNETAYCGDIYALTLSLEGELVLWGEYQDMMTTAGPTMAWFRQMFGNQPVSITDGGRFAWAPTAHGGFCFDARVLTKPRLIGRMTQLSGRVTDVCCVPLGQYPDVTGSGGLYELDGGTAHKPYLGLYGYCGELGGSIPGQGN